MKKHWCHHCGKDRTELDIVRMQQVGDKLSAEGKVFESEEQLSTFKAMAEIFCTDCWVEEGDRYKLLQRFFSWKKSKR